MNKPLIITIPNLSLKEPTDKVSSFGGDLATQIKEMVALLRKEGGIGLAANQIGYRNQVIVIEFIDHEEKKKEHIPLSIFINPEIVEYSPEKECFEEGCLSIPKIELDIERPKTLKLKYEDEHGHKLKIAPKGILARVLQHEVDHLNGILFTEHAKEQFNKNNPEFKNLKIVFLGTGTFASIMLEGLILLGLNLEIFTEKSKPAGRKQEVRLSPVAEMAKKFSKNYFEVEDISNIPPSDLLICGDFGQKIPKKVLDQVKIAPIVIHPSLLPKHHGPTPIQTAILKGDKKIGVSIIKMTEKIDEGPLYSQIETELSPTDDYPVTRDRLATLGLKLLVKTMPKIVRDEIEAVEQDKTKITYTKKFSKNDGKINWQKSPKTIERQIRALYPWPGTYTFIEGKRLIIHQAHLEEKKLVLDIVQLEGKKPILFKEFLKGLRGKKPSWMAKVLLSN